MISILEGIDYYVKVPDGTVSQNEHDRVCHLDLADRTEVDLRRELAFTRWLNFITNSPWHQDREDAIGQELRRRHDAQRSGRAS